MKPRIGISMSREHVGGYPREYLHENYVEAVALAGGLPILLPNLLASVEALTLCDGLLLTGGGDFDPQAFGAADGGTDWSDVSLARDAVELALMRVADQSGIPVLGICRGIQALAIGFGGSVIQDLATALPNGPIRHSRSQARRHAAHAIAVVPGTLTERVLGVTHLEVNSFHHQAVDRVPSGWIVSARADDQVIEAIERPGSTFRLGVQWHPENLIRDDEPSRRLFAAFIGACNSSGH